MPLKPLLIMSLICFLAPQVASAAEITGALMQGGYVYGIVPEGSKVFLGKEQIKTGPEGRFFAGLHRRFPAEGEIRIQTPTGEIEKHTFIVTPQAYKTQHVKGVQQKHVSPDPKQVARSRKEAAAIRKARSFFSHSTAVFEPFVLPVKDKPLSGIYGSSRTFNGEERSWHKGLDLAAPEGTPIYAPAAGTVRAALADTFFNGNIIVLDHGYGLFSIYAHLSRMQVTEGDIINQGDLLGAVGETGRATGPHLHWGMYWHNIALDPKLFLSDNERSNL